MYYIFTKFKLLKDVESLFGKANGESTVSLPNLNIQNEEPI